MSKYLDESGTKIIADEIKKAKSAADAAQQSADDASSNAAAAQSLAETASETANTADSTATDALRIANEAKSKAETAESTANSAKSDAEDANTKAELAQTDATSAKTASEEAKSTAEEAKEAEKKHEENSDVHITAEERDKWNNASEHPQKSAIEYGIRFPINASSPTGERVKRVDEGEIQTWDISYTPNVGSVTDNPFEAIKLFNPDLYTDSAGNVFRTFERFYTAFEKTNDYLYYWVCSEKVSDKYNLPRAFYKNGQPYWNHVDIGVYEGGQESQGGKTCLNSKSGKTLWTNQTRTAAFDGAKAWNTYLSVDTSKETYLITQLSEITEILQPLLLIMFGTRNSQSIYNGVVSASSYISTGGSDSISALNGTTSNDGKNAFKALGIENIWGNVYKRIVDLTMKDRKAYVCENLDEWTDVDPTTNASFKDSGITIPSSSGYIKSLAQSESHPDVILPDSTSGGSSSTYFADYCYQNSGVCTACFGGYYYNADNAGLFYWDLYYSLTNTSADFGARLSHRRL